MSDNNDSNINSNALFCRKRCAALMSTLCWSTVVVEPSFAFVSVQQQQHQHSTTATRTTTTGLFVSPFAAAPVPRITLFDDFDNCEWYDDVDRVGQATTARNHPMTSLVTNEDELTRRKLEWASRYTSIEALRQTFGTNSNKLWGDLQATTARKLYKTLLPRALLELSQLGVGQLQPQDLAPLAYQARLAAKMYARERCTVPARIGATLFDGFRQWIKYGRFQGNGMTYDQLWEKYADQVVEECDGIHDEQVVCLKILERACVSNEHVDRTFLESKAAQAPLKPKQRQVLEHVKQQLEQDMVDLLLPERATTVTTATRSTSRRPWGKKNHVLIIQALAKQRRLLDLRKRSCSSSTSSSLEQQEEQQFAVTA